MVVGGARVAAVTLLFYEGRRIGWAAIIGPPLVAIGVVALALTQQAAGNRTAVAPLLSVSLDVMPLMAGFGAAALVADPALELQLSMPTSFPLTVLRRLLLSAAWPALLAATFEVALWLTGRRLWTPVVPLDELVWLAPLVALAGLGLAGAATLRSMAAASGLVAVFWLAQELLAASIARAPWLQPVWLFYRYAPGTEAAWLLNRMVLLGAGVILCALAFQLLQRTESLIAMGSDT